MKIQIPLILMIAVLISLAPPARADRYGWMETGLVRGVRNLATAPGEIPKAVDYQNRMYPGTGRGMIGLAEGLGKGAIRIAAGVVDLAFWTFHIPVNLLHRL